jgi:hypothetical protein
VEVVELLRKRGLPLRFSLGRNSIREDVIGLIKKRVVYKFKEISNTKELLYYDIGTLVTSDGEIVGFYASVGLFGFKGEKWIKKYEDIYLAAVKSGVKVRKVTQRIGLKKGNRSRVADSAQGRSPDNTKVPARGIIIC